MNFMKEIRVRVVASYNIHSVFMIVAYFQFSNYFRHQRDI
jgi:hypothetical protein